MGACDCEVQVYKCAIRLFQEYIQIDTVMAETFVSQAEAVFCMRSVPNFVKINCINITLLGAIAEKNIPERTKHWPSFI